MEPLTVIRRAAAVATLLTLLFSSCHSNDVRDRAIDFFSLLKNHLLPQQPTEPDPSASSAQHTEVRGNCLHEYYAVQPGVPLTLTSTNYPGPYPPNECRKLVLTPTDAYTSVVMVCTDVDTFGTGVLGRVTGDMLEFPGAVVNRKVHTVYGVDVTQCAAVPFTRRAAPGQALKMGFFSDDFVQRRGFSCQVWGAAVQRPPQGLVEYESGPSGSEGTIGPQQHQQHQQQGSQNNFQPQGVQHQQQQQFQPQQFQPSQQHQFQQQEFQPQEQFQQPFQQQQFQQQEFQEQFQPQPDQQEFKEQAQRPVDTQSLITGGFQQVLPLLNIPGYRRPTPGGGNAPAPPRRPNIGALQGLASLFVPYSAPRQSRPARPPSRLRGPSRGSRGGSRNPRRLRRPIQRVAHHHPAGYIRFPNERRRRRRSLAELLKARILTGDSDIQSIATSTEGQAPVLSDEPSDWSAVFVDDDQLEVEPAPPSQSAEHIPPHQDSGGFTPPEKVEYIFTPIRFSAPFDPEKGPPAFFRRERVTSNTTESPLKVVPYVVTPHPVVLHATADGAQVMSHLRPPRPKQFPTTPQPWGQRLSRRPVVTSKAPGVIEQSQTQETTAENAPTSQSEESGADKSTQRPVTEATLTTERSVNEATQTTLDRIDESVPEDANNADESKEGSRRVDVPDEDVTIDGQKGNRKKGSSQKSKNEQKNVDAAKQPVRRVDTPSPKPKPKPQRPKEKQSVPDVDRPNEEGCGLAGPAVQARVFGGEDALPGSYPWVVYLVSDSPKSTTKTTYCTGSLISRRWVLTAAHCVDYAVTTTISMGYLDVSKETNLTLKMESNDYRVHPYWTRLAKEHDVALVRLPRDVTWTEHVRPICLPRRSEVGNTFVEARAEICGWGKTYNDQKGGSFVLQRAEVPIRSNCDCMASFPINMTPLKICCHGRFHSPCQGDSGGPLQLRRHGRYTLLGVSSFTSAQGCDVGMPAIYTRVTAYLDWIEDNSGLVVSL
ncbi:serine proteinase stubble-like [Amphibalanus amphitrite]|uniref:serine proteinase stubble-like n=1 Tax=Amphibalanus amphitrite TaxID=1232801 RepID=UPI001C8FB71A|nr:serine proteinase stubble-like [Amphibalanus amphitrite]